MLPLKLCTPPQFCNIIPINHIWNIIEGINPRFFMINIQWQFNLHLLTLGLSIFAYNHACHNLYQSNLIYLFEHVFQLVKVLMSTIHQIQQVIQFYPWQVNKSYNSQIFLHISHIHINYQIINISRQSIYAI